MSTNVVHVVGWPQLRARKLPRVLYLSNSSKVRSRFMSRYNYPHSNPYLTTHPLSPAQPNLFSLNWFLHVAAVFPEAPRLCERVGWRGFGWVRCGAVRCRQWAGVGESGWLCGRSSTSGLTGAFVAGMLCLYHDLYDKLTWLILACHVFVIMKACAPYYPYNKMCGRWSAK